MKQQPFNELGSSLRMRRTPPPLGSSAWVEQTFNCGPTRDPRGRSRPTQRYITNGNGFDTSPIVAEGGNTATARSLLTVMMNLGLVRRIKLEPFELTQGEHGVDAVPDAIFEHADRRIFVLENKSSAYFIEAKRQQCQQIERVMSEAGLTYVFWTDAWPLNRPTTRLMKSLRRCGYSAVPDAQLEALRATLDRRNTTIAELRTLSVYREAVMHEVWHGRACINLFADLSDDSCVSRDPSTTRFNAALRAPVDAQGWWHRLVRT